jgi:hypothetical protein
MPRRRPVHLATPPRVSPLLVAAALVLTSACERSPATVRSDAAASGRTAVVESTFTTRTRNGWNPAAGSALLVQGASRDEAIVLFPVESDSDAVAQLDSASLSEIPVALFGRGGARFSAQLGAPTGEGTDDCERWPLRAFQTTSGGTAWSIGFVNGRVAPLALDSVAVLPARDSMALAAEASRLASLVTVPSGPTFQGLRFSAHDIRRFEAAPGVHAIVAHLIRRVNQEADPQEEQTLLIAERDSGVTSGPYQLAYAERTFGREEKVAMPEVLAGVRIAGQPTLVVARDGDEGIIYTMLERTGVRRWRARWSSGVTSCG